jgi:hypothetical protein
MKTRKSSLMVVSLCLAFIACTALCPTLSIGSVQVETADFGEVAVGITSTIPLSITNTGGDTLILYFDYANYSCNFSWPSQELMLQPGDTVVVEISWTPPEGSEGTTCSDTLKIFYGGDFPKTVLVTGKAVDAGALPKNLTPDTISIGEYNTGVLDRDYKGTSISELISACAADVKNHGEFVSCVTHLTNELKEDGVITGEEKSAIQSCAVKAKLAHSLSSRRP